VLTTRAPDDQSISSALPPADERIVKPLSADLSSFSGANVAMDAFAEACPLGSTSSGSKRSSALLGNDTDKRPRLIGAASAAAEVAADALQLTHEQVTCISSDSPVADFWEMLRDGVQDRKQAAFDQMGGVIVMLLGQSHSTDDTFAEKGIRCLREMRRGAVAHHLPTLFNETLTLLRNKYRGADSGLCDYWAMLKQDIGPSRGLGDGLITGDEVPSSTVSAGDAALFLSESAGEPIPAVGLPTLPMDEPLGDDDPDLDCLD
jgi:hypothetical protein